MQLPQAAQWANIVAVIPATYCAYGTWILLHVGTRSQVPAGQLAPAETIRMVNVTGMLISLGAFLACVVVGAVLAGIARKRTRAVHPEPTLTIRSAIYGTGPVNDMDVTSILQKHSGDALVLPVENDTFGRDPAPNRLKRLAVEYAYGNQAVIETSRPEHSRLVLPEDSWLLGRSEQLAAVLQERQEAQKRVSELATQTNTAEAKVREQAREIADLKGKFAAAQAELQPFKEAHAEAGRRAALEAVSLRSAPQLLIRHKRSGGPEEQVLTFISDGEATILNVELGPATWEGRLPIGLNAKVGILQARYPEERGVWAEPTPGVTDGLYEYLDKYAPGVAVSVTVRYEDSAGRKFRRSFTLKPQADRSIQWKPSLVAVQERDAKPALGSE